MINKGKDWKRITLYVLPEEHKRLRITSFENSISMSEYIRNIIMQSLTKIKEKSE